MSENNDQELIMFSQNAGIGLCGFVFIFLLVFSSGINAVDEHVWLHVEGRYIRKSPVCVDPNGVWMGCGVAHRRSNSNETGGSALMSSKVNWLASKSAYINLARISTNNLTDFSSASLYVSNYLAPLVQLYKAKNIYIIIDSHYYMHDSTLQNGYFWDVNNPSSMCRRWLDDWVYVANYFKDEPWVLGYELCNEPVITNSNPAYVGTAVKTRNNYKECIRRIRQVDTKHIILVGNSFWSHASNIKDTWETGLSANEKYNPDPGYGQVVFAFHEYTRSFPLYAGAGGYVNDELGRIQNTFNVPLMCTEFGQDNVSGTPPEWEIRQFESEMIEMCYGQPKFWQGAPISDAAYPSRGTPEAFRMGWIIWRLAGINTAEFEDTSNWSDLWVYAAQRQASPDPQLLTDFTGPSNINQVRDGSAADIDTTNSTVQLSANWDAATDAESGIAMYWYAIGTRPAGTDVVDWTSTGTSRSVTRTALSLEVGTRYYFAVKAENGVGFQSAVTDSNGQIATGGTGDGNGTPNSIAYPNPYSLSDGKPLTFRIDGAAGGQVSIYSTMGRLVRELTVNKGVNEITWDCKNKNGEIIGEGIYIYSMQTLGGKTCRGKFGIIK